MEDKLFSQPFNRQFVFDEGVAAVFDDMITRSVPFYRENLEWIVALLLRRLEEGMRVVDLGSSTGMLLIELARRLKVDVTLIGIDSAPSMVELACKKAEAFDVDVSFVCADLMTYDFTDADVIICNYTLQFIRPLVRFEAVERIYHALVDHGLLLMSEKVVMEDRWLGKQIIDIYHEYKKRQGYSQTEIMRKREALENVLIPYTIEENKRMLTQAGFASVDTIFQWGNFVMMAAAKEGDAFPS